MGSGECFFISETVCVWMLIRVPVCLALDEREKFNFLLRDYHRTLLRTEVAPREQKSVSNFKTEEQTLLYQIFI